MCVGDLNIVNTDIWSWSTVAVYFMLVLRHDLPKKLELVDSASLPGQLALGLPLHASPHAHSAWLTIMCTIYTYYKNSNDSDFMLHTSVT